MLGVVYNNLKTNNMTPKEKAKDLINKYSKIRHSVSNHVNTRKSKECALIAVDEILKFGWNLPHYDLITGEDYWKQVKQEIERL